MAPAADLPVLSVAKGTDDPRPSKPAPLAGFAIRKIARIFRRISTKKARTPVSGSYFSISAFEVDNVVVGYDVGNLKFDGQIEIEGTEDGAFSLGGDSGSLIFNEDKKAVALLFAGGDQGGKRGKGLTYGNPIERVFEELEIKLLY
jgi:hypothetical protein